MLTSAAPLILNPSPDADLHVRRMDREVWRASKQLAAHGADVVQFEGVREVPSILLFLTLQEDQGNGGQRQRDAGGGRYKRLMDSVGARLGFAAWAGRERYDCQGAHTARLQPCLQLMEHRQTLCSHESVHGPVQLESALFVL